MPCEDSIVMNQNPGRSDFSNSVRGFTVLYQIIKTGDKALFVVIQVSPSQP